MTGTELLMEVAEAISRDGEVLDVLVIYSDENNNVTVNGNCSMTRALGLARYADKHIGYKLVHPGK